jgi:hypothetical protein
MPLGWVRNAGMLEVVRLAECGALGTDLTSHDPEITTTMTKSMADASPSWLGPACTDATAVNEFHVTTVPPDVACHAHGTT